MKRIILGMLGGGGSRATTIIMGIVKEIFVFLPGPDFQKGVHSQDKKKVRVPAEDPVKFPECLDGVRVPGPSPFQVYGFDVRRNISSQPGHGQPVLE